MVCWRGERGVGYVFHDGAWHFVFFFFLFRGMDVGLNERFGSVLGVKQPVEIGNRN